jgi:hypothetical protein
VEPITNVDFLKKVDSDFPYSTRRGRSSHQHQRKSYMTKNIIESLPEMVEEEKNEEEEVRRTQNLNFYRSSTRGLLGSR